MKIIAGNWKLNGTGEMMAAMLDALSGIETKHTVIICPPFTLLGAARIAPVAFGAQDCSLHESGAFTGDVSAAMISEAGAKYAIVGHSERRLHHCETNEIVAAKAAAAHSKDLIPIICVGETKEQKENGQTLEIIESQVRQSVCKTFKTVIVAYEPVWAIGTGLTPTVADIESIHAHIAKVLESMDMQGTCILYGGSVKGSNAAEIISIPNVGGVLVGGASLKPDDFLPIIDALK